MCDKKLIKPNAPLVKFKYESSFFNVEQGKPNLEQRFSVNCDGVIYKTLSERNQAGRRLVQKRRIDIDEIKRLFDNIEYCIFDESSQVDYPIDDVERKIELHYEGKKPIKLYGVYSADGQSTETVIDKFVQAYLL